MTTLMKYAVTFIAVGTSVAAGVYFAVLPQLGRSVSPPQTAGLSGDAKRGKYLAIASGCLSCHTDYKNKGDVLAGGPAIETPFGTFYGPNITPDRTHGIGGWSLSKFTRALTAGVAPDDGHYFPSLPYTSYAAMKPQDIADIKAYLDMVPAVSQASRPHEISWPFSDRTFLGFWKWLNFDPEELNARIADGDRGAYLVNVLGHCAECHTKRGFLGNKTGLPFAGNPAGPGGAKVPGLRSLTSDGRPWTVDQIKLSLQVGMIPNGDFLGGTMAEVVEHSTSKLSDADRTAMATYLKGLR